MTDEIYEPTLPCSVDQVKGTYKDITKALNNTLSVR